jgi:hypothetical protein
VIRCQKRIITKRSQRDADRLIDGGRTAARAKVSAGRLRRAQTFLRGAGHRHWLQSGRPGREQDDQDTCNSGRYPSAPSAASATNLHHDPSATAAVALTWSAGTRSSKSLHPPTTLTVLTQMPLFGNYGHPDGPSGAELPAPGRGGGEVRPPAASKPGSPHCVLPDSRAPGSPWLYSHILIWFPYEDHA